MIQDSCHMGMEYINLLMQNHQKALDAAFMRSVQLANGTGMQGEPLPYMLRSDAVVSCLIVLCFVLYAYSFSRGKKFILQRLKNLFQYKERASLFDETAGAGGQYISALVLVTSILSGIAIYSYVSETNPLLLRFVSHSVLLGIYIAAILAYVACKWCAYAFVNWIFFDKEKNSLWMQSYWGLMSGCSLVLIPVILLIVYLNLDFETSKFLLLTTLVSAKFLLFFKCIRNFFYRLYGFLHFIVYFCALEVIPLVLLWKGIACLNDVFY